MLTYIEQGTKFTNTYGDIDEPFYNSLESMLYEFKKGIETDKTGDYLDNFKERLKKLYTNAHNLGWGYGDTVSEIMEELGIIK